MRLPVTLRMKRSCEFLRVRKHGVSQAGRYSVLAVLKDEAVQPFRFGVVTGKKLGGAVVRVRLRRRFREIVRALQAEFTPGWLIVIIPRWRAVEADYAELLKDWRKTACKLGLILSSTAAP